MAITVDAVLGADVSGFVSGMDRARTSFQETARVITSGGQSVNATLGGMTQSTSDFTKVLNTLGVAIGALSVGLIGFSRSSFAVAADVAEMAVAMDAVGKSSGVGAKALREAADAVRSKGIEMKASQEIALLFVKSNLDLARASDLARVAQDFAVLSQRNSTDTAKTLAYAIQTGNSQLLKGVGITRYAGEAYASYARELGKSANNLTATERQQAVLNMVMEEGAKVAGTYEAAMTEPGKVLRSFPRILNDVKLEFGRLFLEGFSPVVLGAYNTFKQFSLLIREGGALFPVLQALRESFTTLVEPLAGVFAKVKDFFKSIELTNVNVGQLSETINKFIPLIGALAAGLSAFAGKNLLGQLPLVGPMLQNFAVKLSPVGIGLAALVALSPELRAIFIDLLGSLKPLLPAIMDLGQTLFQVFEKVMESVVNVATNLQGVVGTTLTGLANVILGLSQVVLPVVSAFASLATVLTSNKIVMLALLPIVTALVLQKKLMGVNADGTAKAFTRLAMGFTKMRGQIAEQIAYQKTLAAQQGLTITSFQALRAAGVTTFMALKAGAMSLMASLGPMIAMVVAVQLIVAAISAFGAKQRENAARTNELSDALRANTKELLANKEALEEGATGQELLSDAILTTGENSDKLVDAFGRLGMSASLEKFAAAADDFEGFAASVLKSKGASEEAAVAMAKYIAETDDNDFDSLVWSALDMNDAFTGTAKALEEIQDQIEKTDLSKIVQDQVNAMVGSGQLTTAMINQATALAEADAAANGWGEEQKAVAFNNYLMAEATAYATRKFQEQERAAAEFEARLAGMEFYSRGHANTTKTLASIYDQLRVEADGAEVALEDYAKGVQKAERANILLFRASRSTMQQIQDIGKEIVNGKQSFDDFKNSAYDLGDAILSYQKTVRDGQMDQDVANAKIQQFIQEFIAAGIEAGRLEGDIRMLLDQMGLLNNLDPSITIYFNLDSAKQALEVLSKVYAALYAIPGASADIAKVLAGIQEAQRAVDAFSTKRTGASSGRGGGSRASQDPFAWVKEWVDDLVDYANDQIGSSALADLAGVTAVETATTRIVAVFDELNAKAAALGLKNIPAVSNALSLLKGKFEELGAAVEARDGLVGQLDSALARLGELSSSLDAIRQEAGQVAAGLNIDIAGAVLPTDTALSRAQSALQEYQRLVDERNSIIQNASQYASSVAQSMMPTVGGRGNAIANTSRMLEEVRRFRDGIIQMRDRGFPQDLIAEVVGLGAREGGLLAERLLNMSGSDFQQLVSMREQIRSVAAEVATVATTVLFETDLNEANTAVNDQLTLVQSLFATAVSEAEAAWREQQTVVSGLQTAIGNANDSIRDLIDAIQVSFHDTMFEFLAGFTGALDRLQTPTVSGRAVPLAEGGIVTRGTLALVGEAGAEAVIPLSQAGAFGGTTINVTVQGSVSTERDLVEAIRVGLLRVQKSGGRVVL